MVRVREGRTALQGRADAESLHEQDADDDADRRRPAEGDLARLPGAPQDEADAERSLGAVRPLEDVAAQGRREGLGEDEREEERRRHDLARAEDVLQVQRHHIDVAEVADADEERLQERRVRM